MSKLYSYSYPFLLNVINLHSKTLMADVSWEKNTDVWNPNKSKAQDSASVIVGPSLTASSPSNNETCLNSSKICNGVTNLPAL